MKIYKISQTKEQLAQQKIEELNITDPFFIDVIKEDFNIIPWHEINNKEEFKNYVKRKHYGKKIDQINYWINLIIKDPYYYSSCPSNLKNYPQIKQAKFDGWINKIINDPYSYPECPYQIHPDILNALELGKKTIVTKYVDCFNNFHIECETKNTNVEQGEGITTWIYPFLTYSGQKGKITCYIDSDVSDILERFGPDKYNNIAPQLKIQYSGFSFKIIVNGEVLSDNLENYCENYDSDYNFEKTNDEYKKLYIDGLNKLSQRLNEEFNIKFEQVGIRELDATLDSISDEGSMNYERRRRL